MLACLGGRLRSAETSMSNGLLTTGATGGGGESCGSDSGKVECTLMSSNNTGLSLNLGAMDQANCVDNAHKGLRMETTPIGHYYRAISDKKRHDSHRILVPNQIFVTTRKSYCQGPQIYGQDANENKYLVQISACHIQSFLPIFTFFHRSYQYIPHPSFHFPIKTGLVQMETRASYPQMPVPLGCK